MRFFSNVGDLHFFCVLGLDSLLLSEVERCSDYLEAQQRREPVLHVDEELIVEDPVLRRIVFQEDIEVLACNPVKQPCARSQEVFTQSSDGEHDTEQNKNYRADHLLVAGLADKLDEPFDCDVVHQNHVNVHEEQSRAQRKDAHH